MTDKRLKELAARTDAQIDYSEIPELDDAFWKNAQLLASLKNDDRVRLACTKRKRPARED